MNGAGVKLLHAVQRERKALVERPGSGGRREHPGDDVIRASGASAVHRLAKQRAADPTARALGLHVERGLLAGSRTGVLVAARRERRWEAADGAVELGDERG